MAARRPITEQTHDRLAAAAARGWEGTTPEERAARMTPVRAARGSGHSEETRAKMAAAARARHAALTPEQRAARTLAARRARGIA